MLREARLFFEPKEGVMVNHTDMFKHYVMNWISDFETARFGGIIAMNHREKKTNNKEPVWQVIISEPDTMMFGELCDYVERNPLCGYYTHIYKKESGKNSEHMYVY